MGQIGINRRSVSNLFQCPRPRTHIRLERGYHVGVHKPPFIACAGFTDCTRIGQALETGKIAAVPFVPYVDSEPAVDIVDRVKVIQMDHPDPAHRVGECPVAHGICHEQGSALQHNVIASRGAVVLIVDLDRGGKACVRDGDAVGLILQVNAADKAHRVNGAGRFKVFSVSAVEFHPFRFGRHGNRASHGYAFDTSAINVCILVIIHQQFALCQPLGCVADGYW